MNPDLTCGGSFDPRVRSMGITRGLINPLQFLFGCIHPEKRKKAEVVMKDETPLMAVTSAAVVSGTDASSNTAFPALPSAAALLKLPPCPNDGNKCAGSDAPGLTVYPNPV
jgi:hypothetical protein